MQRIDSFTGKYSFLSNFYPSPITIRGIEYPTVEHAYQAMKTLNYEDRIRIASLPTPGKAKRAGRKVELRTGWDDLRIPMMYSLLLLKFTEHPELRAELLRTGNAELVEGNRWGDTFWGVCDGVGSNHLGRLLMHIRAILRD